MYRQLILASASPRRRELLEQMGVDFQIMPAKGEEIITKDEPREVVLELAMQKAAEIGDRLEALREAEEIAAGPPSEEAANREEAEAYLVLGADTVVACEGRILGKPRDEAEAIKMLRRLRGRTHQVYTGVALIDLCREGRRSCRFYQETQVEMFPFTDAEILAYVKTGEPMDKAGAYGIQGKGAVLIKEIRGDYNNVVGLPVAELYQQLKRLGIEISAKA